MVPRCRLSHMSVCTATFPRNRYFWHIKAKWQIALEIINLMQARLDTPSGKTELDAWVSELGSDGTSFPTRSRDYPFSHPQSRARVLLERMRLQWLLPRPQQSKGLECPTPISLVMELCDVGRSPVYKAIPISPKELLQWEQSNAANPFVLLSLPSAAFGETRLSTQSFS